jgi:D-sedoheptulose 7-phosphate isomerase
MIEHIKANLVEARSALDQLMTNETTLVAIEQAGQCLADCFRQQGHVYSCGNGGSMCDAMHFAEELAGRFRQDRAALGAMAMADGAYLTCAGNDFGFDEVFARFVEAHGRSGDVLLAISTSGKSENVLRAVRRAQERSMKVIGLTGRPQSALGELVDIEICTPGGSYADRVQELHIKVIHILIELVERQMFGEAKEA